MTEILIIEQNPDNIAKIALKIEYLFPKAIIIFAIKPETAIMIIKAANPKKVVLDLTMKDGEGNDLLDLLGNRDFEVLTYNNNELYKLKESKKYNGAGMFFKKLKIIQ